MNETPRPRYRFGEVTLSPGRRLLLRGGEPVALAPRYLDLLMLLVAERHRVVEREEIHQLVWGGVAVTDGAFTQAVRTVRRALGDDDPREPRFIRTAARHGYQFVFPEVREEDDAAPLAQESTRATPLDAANDERHEPAAEALEMAAPRAPVPAPTNRAAIDGLLGGAVGAGATGVAASLLLGTLLILAGGGHWPLLPVLCAIGAAVGGWGGGSVGAGIELGAAQRRWPRVASVLLGAAGGGLAGAIGHQLVGWTMSELLGRQLTAFGGALEGVVLGGAVALGLALGTGGGGGRRDARATLGSVLAAAVCGAIAAGVLAAAGARLAGISLDAIADALKGVRVMAPLGTYLGEPPPLGERGAGPATRLAVSLLEGGFFGAGVAWGLGWRRRAATASARTGAAS